MDMDSAGPIAFVIITVALLDGLVGYLVGKAKNNGSAGFWFGFFLSAVGWIIAALLPDNRYKKAGINRYAYGYGCKICQFCGAKIPRGQDKCPDCGEAVAK
jgi:hypothetical protein